MKKIILGIMLLTASMAVFAEASFSQIETLIEQKQYSAAAAGLEEILRNHPQSAKAYYAMAQAQAGLGHLDKARYALDKAQGLEPSLSFASSGNIESLRQAITPQTTKIEPVSEGHFWAILFSLIILGILGYYAYRYFNDKNSGGRNYGGVDPIKPQPYTPSGSQTAQTTSQQTAYSRPTARPTYTPTYQQPVVNNHYHDNGSDFLTGMVVGEMLSGNHHGHDTTIINNTANVSESRHSDSNISSSWDNDAPSKSSSISSSWDSDSESKSSSSSSSSWGSSSSSSSSSWDSDSSSSSSWDSDSSSSSDW